MQSPNPVIFDAFVDQVQRFPKKIALIVDGELIHYTTLLSRVKELETILLQSDVKKAPIAVISENGFLLPVAALLASKISQTIVPIASGLRPKQMQALIKIAKPSLVIMTKLTSASSNFLQQLPQRDFSILEVNSATDLRVTRFLEPDKILAPKLEETERSFVMNFTSGSTGAPKPVCISQVTKLDRIFAGTVALFGVTSEDVTLVSTPQYHSLGFRQTLVPLLTGGTGVVLPRFSVEGWIDAVEHHKITFTIGVASQLSQVVANLDEKSIPKLASLSTLVSSSAAFSPQQREICRGILQCRIFECYGASEIGIATTLEICQEGSHQQNVGFAPEYAEICIFEENTKMVQAAVGSVGEIGVKSQLAFTHYHELPDITEQAFVNDFFLTGDLGYLSVSGELFLVGRANDTIKNSGITVYPSDIEQCCKSISGVLDACAVGIPDRLGHEKIGLLVAASDCLSDNQILRHLMGELAPWQVPTKISRALKIPLTEIGKVDRHAVIKRIIDGLETECDKRN